MSADTAADRSQPRTDAEQLRPGLFAIYGPDGNALLVVGSTRSLVVGSLSAATSPDVQSVVRRQHGAPVTLAVLVDGRPDGDGGAGKSSDALITVAHEGIRQRLIMEAMRQRQSRTPAVGVPTIGFSDVVQLWADGHDVHVVHQPTGYGGSDIIAHVEHEGVLFLPNVFVTDGYPSIDVDHGGSVDGMLTSLRQFAEAFRSDTSMLFLPGRGRSTKYRGFRSYFDMLSTIRNRVRAMVDSGFDETTVRRKQPTRDFDEAWGHGPVSGPEFAGLVFRSMHH